MQRRKIRKKKEIRQKSEVTLTDGNGKARGGKSAAARRSRMVKTQLTSCCSVELAEMAQLTSAFVEPSHNLRGATNNRLPLLTPASTRFMSTAVSGDLVFYGSFANFSDSRLCARNTQPAARSGLLRTFRAASSVCVTALCQEHILFTNQHHCPPCPARLVSIDCILKERDAHLEHRFILCLETC